MAAQILASPFEARLVDESGRPLPGVTMVRRVSGGFLDSKLEQKTQTDAEGRFVFAEMTQRSLLTRFYPHEAVIGIQVLALIGHREVQVFSVTKRDYLLHGETAGRHLSWEFDPHAARLVLELKSDTVVSRTVTARLSSAAQMTLVEFIKGPVNEAEAERVNRMFEESLKRAQDRGR